MIINTRADLEALSKAEQDSFKQKLAAGINGWEWSGIWVQVQNTATIKQFGFTISDFPDAPVPPMPTSNPDQQEQERKAAEVEENRKAAYISESDPLFFKAQRGEATMEDWQAKVDEIKQRFPDQDVDVT